MEREYLIAFILVLVVIFISIITVQKYYPQMWNGVSDIAKDVFEIGKEKEKMEIASSNIDALIESLVECQKISCVNCTCPIKNKKPMPEDYRIVIQMEEKDGKNSMLIFAFTKEEKIIPLRAESQGLELEGLKLGIAYWGSCQDCSPGIYGKAVDNPWNDIFCVFNSKTTGNTPIVIKGDKDNDWAFQFFNTQGVPFDQLHSRTEYIDIGNILKIDSQTYCLLTSNLLRHDNNFNVPKFTSKDNVIKLFNGFTTPQTATQFSVMENTMDAVKNEFKSCSSLSWIKGETSDPYFDDLDNK